jgi:hypothetical protein
MIMTEFLFVHKKQKVKLKLKNNSLTCQSCTHRQRNFNRVNVAENEMNARSLALGNSALVNWHSEIY